MPLQPHSPPDCAFGTTHSIVIIRNRQTHTHAHTTQPSTHHPPTPPPLPTQTPTTNQSSQTTQTNHPQTNHPPTRNVIDRLSLGDKMDAMYCNFLSQPLFVRTGQCARLLPSLDATTVSQAQRERLVATSDQQFIMSHHEHNRRKKRSACLCGVCGVLCCRIVVLHVTWCVCLPVVVCVWCLKPIKCTVGGFYKQPVDRTS